ncbi:MAG: UDP-2,3-diacylglucosamine diphosphatase [Burkholderiales bacterium]|nr:UDP-2,3-diacylglucosamine diphosphatase [Burkholderiales bacterium]
MAGPTLLISDLHLSAARPAATAAFLALLAGPARDAAALYILGDLFDYWIGDEDIDDPAVRPIVDALAAVSNGGTAVSFMHGNRDFLVGERFAAATGIRLLPDPLLLQLDGVPTLLMHGDTLCLEDAAYNRFRAAVRDPAWQQAFLARPVAARREEAQRLRAISEHEKKSKPAEIMDVTPSEVLRTLRAFDYPRLVHGHTHRPGRHLHPVDGRPCERWVLPDWQQVAAGLRADQGRLSPF